MKRVLLIHCWEGTPDYCWYPWLKETLEPQGIEVTVPQMPETDHPQLEKWLPKMQELIGEPDDDLILVGHSVGCISILRYLESLPQGQKVGTVIFVAGFTDDLGFNEISSFFKTPINWEKIRSHCPQFTVIHSDNDPYVDLKYADIFKDKLNAEVIVKPGMKHFSGPLDDEESCLKLEELIEKTQ